MRFLTAVRRFILSSALLLPASLPADDLLLRVRAKVTESLARLPNYTCLETIDRNRRGDPCPTCEINDRVRLEVAVIEGKERFAWPGAGRFQDREVDEILKHGAVESGNFSGFLKDVFVSGIAAYKLSGEETVAGRPAVRHDYRVPLRETGYRIRSGGMEANVEYHGSFWTDPVTLDLIRVEVHCDDIPPRLDMASASTAVNYGRLRIGAEDFLLPRSVELIITTPLGVVDRNTTRFTECRQFQGASTIFFDEHPAMAAHPMDRTRLVALPPELTIEAELAQAIDMAHAAIGDPIQAVVRKPVRRKDEVLVPKGAVLEGRITRTEIHSSGSAGYLRGLTFPAYTVVALEFSTFRFGDAVGNLRASLLDYYGAYRGSDGRLVQVSGRDPAITDFGENGLLFFRARLLEIPKGLGLRLRTLVSAP